MNNDSFCRLHVSSAQCIIGTEKFPDGGIFSNYDDDDYSQIYSQTKDALKALKRDDILQPYISDDDFRSSNAGIVELGYNL